MAARRLVLGVKLDGVCADFYTGLREIAAEWLGVPILSLTTEVSYGLPEWKLDKSGGYDALHRFAVTRRALFLKLSPFDGAAAGLRRLSARNVWIRIITHRLLIPHFHQEAKRQTIEWLDYHGIPYEDLCFMKDKTEAGADLYIEDSPKNIKALRNGGHPTIVFTNSTNRNLPSPRANSWADVERLVASEMANWRKKQRARGRK